MTDRKDTCANCRFFRHWPNHPDGTQDRGDCRKYAPKLGGRWPGVEKTDWCGEHEALPEARNYSTMVLRKDTVECGNCALYVARTTLRGDREVFAAHKCEDHQPANEESDS